MFLRKFINDRIKDSIASLQNDRGKRKLDKKHKQGWYTDNTLLLWMHKVTLNINSFMRAQTVDSVAIENTLCLFQVSSTCEMLGDVPKRQTFGLIGQDKLKPNYKIDHETRMQRHVAVTLLPAA